MNVDDLEDLRIGDRVHHMGSMGVVTAVQDVEEQDLYDPETTNTVQDVQIDCFGDIWIPASRVCRVSKNNDAHVKACFGGGNSL